MSTNVLDEIAREETLKSDENSLSDQNEDSTFLEVDSDNLRLDNASNRRELFVRDSSNINTGADATDDEEEFADVADILTPPRERRVAFAVPAREKVDDINDTFNPWDLKRAVKKGFRERLPENYQIRRWRRPPRTFVQSLVDLMEDNVNRATEEVLSKYENDCSRALKDASLEDFRQDKEEMLYKLIKRFKTRLKRTKFPSRVGDEVLNIEHIYAKRNYLQNMYESELEAAEALEKQLATEHRTLAESSEQDSQDSVRQLMSKLTTDLHPVLHKAVSNAYGVIKDDQNTRETYLNEKEELNLDLDDSDPL